MKQRGFTAVEMIIVITVIAILLVVAFVNIRSGDITARDTERTTDVENLSVALETFYSTAATSIRGGGSRYPGTSAVDAPSLRQMLPDLDVVNLKAPGKNAAPEISLIPATNATETAAGVQPQPTVDTYVYQPIATDGTLCADHTVTDCRRFNIYYYLERDGTVQVRESRQR